MKFRLNSFNGCQVTERTRNSIANDQREITPKIYKTELCFLCMTHRLIVLYNCMKFHLNSFNDFQITERTRNSIANDQRVITPKISKVELWFLCMTHCLIVRYKCMKFQTNSFNNVQLTERTRNCNYLRYKGDNLKKYICKSYGSCQVMEQTQFCDYLCYKGDTLKNTHARVMVLVHDTLSQCAL